MKYFLILLMAFLFVGCGVQDSYTTKKENQIDYILDGDTVKFYSMDTSLRLISIDTPEKYISSRLEYQANECANGNKDIIIDMGEQATYYLESIVDYSYEYKVKIYTIDKYNRYIGKVYDKDNISLNLKMVEEGYAVPYIYEEGQDEDENLYLKAVEEAKQNRRGLWYNYYNEMNCLKDL